MLEARKKQLEDALTEAREISRKSDLTDEERVDLLARCETIEKLKSEVNEDIAIQKALADVQSTDPVAVSETVMGIRNKSSLGDSFVSSEQYAEWRAS